MAKRRDGLAARREAMGFTQEDFARAVNVELSTVGRWERGTLTPQPWRRPKLAKILQVSLEQLAGLLLESSVGDRPEDHRGTSGSGTQMDPAEPGLERSLVMEDAREAARFERRIASSAVSRSTLDQFETDIRQFASDYVSQPLADLFVDIRDRRTEVFRLLEQNRFPEQMTELYLHASRLGGLQAHICLDLGHYREADAQARTAARCAHLAGHPAMRAWVCSLRSLIAYWDSRLDDAVAFAREGAAQAVRGSVSARLPALEARACAARGDKSGAIEALYRAESARAAVRDDGDAGVFTFPAAKQAVYAGTTLLALGDRSSAKRAVHESSRALALYEQAAPADRSSGDILAARLDLASAYLDQDQVDGAREHLKLVLAVPQTRRTASIVKRAKGISDRIETSRYATSRQGTQLCEEITAFCAPQPALPAKSSVQLA